MLSKSEKLPICGGFTVLPKVGLLAREIETATVQNVKQSCDNIIKTSDAKRRINWIACPNNNNKEITTMATILLWDDKNEKERNKPYTEIKKKKKNWLLSCLALVIRLRLYVKQCLKLNWKKIQNEWEIIIYCKREHNDKTKKEAEQIFLES